MTEGLSSNDSRLLLQFLDERVNAVYLDAGLPAWWINHIHNPETNTMLTVKQCLCLAGTYTVPIG